MSLLEAEERLGNTSRRFDDWIVDGMFYSRLTVVRYDGVPQTFEASSGSHQEARRQACILAASALSMESRTMAHHGNSCTNPQFPSEEFEDPSLHSDSNSASHKLGDRRISSQPPLVQTAKYRGALPGTAHLPNVPRYTDGLDDADGINTPSTPPFRDESPLSPAVESQYQRSASVPLHITPNYELGLYDDNQAGRLGQIHVPNPFYSMPGLSPVFALQPMPQFHPLVPVQDVSSTPRYLHGDGMPQLGTVTQQEQFAPGFPVSAIQGSGPAYASWGLGTHGQPCMRNVCNVSSDFPAEDYGSKWISQNAQYGQERTNIGSSARSPSMITGRTTRSHNYGEKRLDFKDFGRTLLPGTGDMLDGADQSVNFGDGLRPFDSQSRRFRRRIGMKRALDVCSNDDASLLTPVDNAKRSHDDRGVIDVQDGQNNESLCVDDAAATEEDDNHLTKFNELCQKGVANLCAPKYQYRLKGDQGGGAPKWECVATTAAQMPGADDLVTLTKTGRGKNKKDARRVTARLLLRELVDSGIINKDTLDAKGPIPLQNSPDKPGEEVPSTAIVSPEVAASVSILNQLWQKERFVCKPKWSIAPVSSGPTGRWQCDLLIRTKQFGDIETSHVSSQKKVCRQMASYNAVQILKNSGFPGIDEVNVHAKPHGNISSHAPEKDSDDDESGIDSCRDEGSSEEDVDPAVKPLDCVTAAFGSAFTIPEAYDITIATANEQCTLWIDQNVKSGFPLGLYLDSALARESHTWFASEAVTGTDNSDDKCNECRVLCFATTNSALLVSAHLLGQAREVENSFIEEVDKIPSDDCERVAAEANGAGDQPVIPIKLSEPSASQNLFTPIANDAQSVSNLSRPSWIPESVRELLEQQGIVKYGLLLEEGAIILLLHHGIRCRHLYDLSVASVALKGVLPKSQSTLPRLEELVRDWLQRQLEPFSLSTLGSFHEVIKLAQSTKDIVAPAIPSALASSMLQERFAGVAESRRRKSYANSHEFDELCNRLCLPPISLCD